MASPLTVRDIARLAAVSPSTVSKAINNRPDIGEKTRERILKIVADEQYTPNAFGRALKSRQSETIGVITPKAGALIGNPNYSHILEGIQTEASLQNYSVMLHMASGASTDRLPKMLREGQIDGLLLIGDLDREYVERINTFSIPALWVDPESPGLHSPHEIRIAGLKNYNVSDISPPVPGTVPVQIRKVGLTAVKKLIRELRRGAA